MENSDKNQPSHRLPGTHWAEHQEEPEGGSGSVTPSGDHRELAWEPAQAERRGEAVAAAPGPNAIVVPRDPVTPAPPSTEGSAAAFQNLPASSPAGPPGAWAEQSALASDEEGSSSSSFSTSGARSAYEVAARIWEEALLPLTALSTPESRRRRPAPGGGQRPRPDWLAPAPNSDQELTESTELPRSTPDSSVTGSNFTPLPSDGPSSPADASGTASEPATISDAPAPSAILSAYWNVIPDVIVVTAAADTVESDLRHEAAIPGGPNSQPDGSGQPEGLEQARPSDGSAVASLPGPGVPLAPGGPAQPGLEGPPGGGWASGGLGPAGPGTGTEGLSQYPGSAPPASSLETAGGPGEGEAERAAAAATTSKLAELLESAMASLRPGERDGAAAADPSPPPPRAASPLLEGDNPFSMAAELVGRMLQALAQIPPQGSGGEEEEEDTSHWTPQPGADHQAAEGAGRDPTGSRGGVSRGGLPAGAEGEEAPGPGQPGARSEAPAQRAGAPPRHPELSSPAQAPGGLREAGESGPPPSASPPAPPESDSPSGPSLKAYTSRIILALQATERGSSGVPSGPAATDALGPGLGGATYPDPPSHLLNEASWATVSEVAGTATVSGEMSSSFQSSNNSNSRSAVSAQETDAGAGAVSGEISSSFQTSNNNNSRSAVSARETGTGTGAVSREISSSFQTSNNNSRSAVSARETGAGTGAVSREEMSSSFQASNNSNSWNMLSARETDVETGAVSREISSSFQPGSNNSRNTVSARETDVGTGAVSREISSSFQPGSNNSQNTVSARETDVGTGAVSREISSSFQPGSNNSRNTVSARETDVGTGAVSREISSSFQPGSNNSRSAVSARETDVGTGAVSGVLPTSVQASSQAGGRVTSVRGPVSTHRDAATMVEVEEASDVGSPGSLLADGASTLGGAPGPKSPRPALTRVTMGQGLDALSLGPPRASVSIVVDGTGWPSGETLSLEVNLLGPRPGEGPGPAPGAPGFRDGQGDPGGEEGRVTAAAAGPSGSGPVGGGQLREASPSPSVSGWVPPSPRSCGSGGEGEEEGDEEEDKEEEAREVLDAAISDLDLMDVPWDDEEYWETFYYVSLVAAREILRRRMWARGQK